VFVDVRGEDRSHSLSRQLQRLRCRPRRRKYNVDIQHTYFKLSNHMLAVMLENRCEVRGAGYIRRLANAELSIRD
jgi:hypothetical protein